MEISAEETKDQLIQDLQEENQALRIERAQLRAGIRKLSKSKEADENASQESQD